MNAIRKLLFVIAVLIVMVLAAVAVNQEPVSLGFLIWNTPAVSVFWWLMIAFLLGVVMGFVLSFFTSFKMRLERRRLRKSVDDQASELQRLRTLSPE